MCLKGVAAMMHGHREEYTGGKGRWQRIMDKEDLSYLHRFVLFAYS